MMNKGNIGLSFSLLKSCNSIFAQISSNTKLFYEDLFLQCSNIFFDKEKRKCSKKKCSMKNILVSKVKKNTWPKELVYQ